jgi:hypothetical protein
MKLLMLLLPAFIVTGLNAEVLVYKETIGNKSREISIIRETRTEGENTILRTEDDEAIIERTLKPDGTGLSMVASGKDGLMRLRLTDGRVEYEGEWEGAARKGSVATNGLPWYPDITDACVVMTKSEKKRLDFLYVEADGSNAKVTLTNQGFETIAGRKALRIKVSLTGILSMFWNATFWMTPEGTMLKYSGKEEPGEPDMVLELSVRE